jgi:transposase
MNLKTLQNQKNSRLRPSDCHAGVVPFNYSSGQYKGKAKTSNKANKQLKALLHNGAMSAIQYSPEIREYYLRKTAEGKNQMLVVNNVCNKLIHRVFSCVHRNGAARAGKI